MGRQARWKDGGPRTAEQATDNLAAAALTLSADQIPRLDTVSAITLGFPHDMLADPGNINLLTAGRADRIAPLARPVR